MARVLLVSYAGYPYSPSSLMPDNGLACLAGCLVDAGHEVLVLDYSTVSVLARLFPEKVSKLVRPLAEKLFVENKKLSVLEKMRFLAAGALIDRHQKKEILRIAREVCDEASAFGAQIVGLKLWNGDGFAGSVKIAETICERLPGVKVLGGGPHVDYFHRHILDYTNAFNFLVRGEGERTLPDLVDALMHGGDWRGIPGLLWRESGKVHSNPVEPISALNDLPLPIYDSGIYPALVGNEKIKIGVLDESRGCPNRCAFCIHPIKSGGKWSLKSPGRVIEEMRCLMKSLGTSCFIYSGSNTSASVAIGIAEEILRQGLKVRYGCFGHVRGIARADFDLLRQSGCEAIFYGLESGSSRILREAFNKAINLQEAERVVLDTKAAGIFAITSIIFPAPFEDSQSRADTMALLHRVRPDSVPVTIPGMLPGTPWETAPEQYGFEKEQRKDIWEYALRYKIKLLFPPSMWKPLPYTLNGKSSKQMISECGKFMSEIENAGMLTDVPHEMALMASALGELKNIRQFRDRCRAYFMSGAADSVADLVANINRMVSPLVKA